MKRAWMVAGTVAVFLPTVFVMWLLLAVGWKKMDALTMRLPEDARSLVVRAMLGQMSDAQTLERAKNIDAVATKEWQSRPRMGFGQADSLTVDTRNTKRAVDLNKMGLQQENAGRQCVAEETFSQAASASSGGNYYSPAEHMGRTALRCGDLGSARAGLETAVFKEGKCLADDDPGDDADDIKATNADMLTDREYLVVVYQRQHEAGLGAATCKQAHADWKGCACGLDAKGDVQCREKR